MKLLQVPCTSGVLALSLILCACPGEKPASASAGSEPAETTAEQIGLTADEIEKAAEEAAEKIDETNADAALEEIEGELAEDE
jgi:hypothetical protein